MERYLIDTNVIIDYLNNSLTPNGMTFIGNVINDTINISVITKIELLGYQTNPEYYQILEDFVNDATVFSINEKVVDLCIEVRKKYKTKLPDALITATALSEKLIIITSNTSDFSNIKSLKVINPNN